MRPGIDHILMLMAGTLATKVSEAMPPDHYAAGDAKMLALMNVLLAQEVDRAADILLRENATLRSLLGGAASHLPPALARQAADAAQTSDADLRIATLESGNALLKSLLIKVHIAAEADLATWGGPLNLEILRFLRRYADERMFSLPPV
jgi:hypothetical protein